ncbi:MAG TPA: hypothetical protein PJ986_18465 [Gammaproteobacteria bacterium]|nr:hypothetical protein [Gammaproteobacteria bacterium]
MRYRDGQLPEQIGAQVPPTDDFVSLTVWLTLFVGLLFVAAGLYGRQRWLQIWGWLTLCACGGYYVWLAAQ